MLRPLFICMVLFNVIFTEDISFRKFMEFTHKYKKLYVSSEELSKKYETFRNNLLEILEVNESELGYSVGITKFSDLSKEEFRSQYLTLQKPNGFCQPSADSILNDAPLSFDWREKGGVSPVKDQGQCGSCWAFSAVAFLESQSLMKLQKSQTFSEQQLVDCDRDVDQGCGGGWMELALRYFSNNGAEYDSDYPYTAKDGQCQYDKGKTKGIVSEVKCIENLDVATIQGMIYNIGPLSIGVDAEAWSWYTKGVMKCQHWPGLNHGVLLIGYTKDSWIIKNSWGADWGESGFIRVSNVKDVDCGVGQYIATATLN